MHLPEHRYSQLEWHSVRLLSLIQCGMKLICSVTCAVFFCHKFNYIVNMLRHVIAFIFFLFKVSRSGMSFFKLISCFLFFEKKITQRVCFLWFLIRLFQQYSSFCFSRKRTFVIFLSGTKETKTITIQSNEENLVLACILSR